MRMGSGVRFKALEAMARGRPARLDRAGHRRHRRPPGPRLPAGRDDRSSSARRVSRLLDDQPRCGGAWPRTPGAHRGAGLGPGSDHATCRCWSDWRRVTDGPRLVRRWLILALAAAHPGTQLVVYRQRTTLLERPRSRDPPRVIAALSGLTARRPETGDRLSRRRRPAESARRQHLPRAGRDARGATAQSGDDPRGRLRLDPPAVPLVVDRAGQQGQVHRPGDLRQHLGRLRQHRRPGRGQRAAGHRATRHLAALGPAGQRLDEHPAGQPRRLRRLLRAGRPPLPGPGAVTTRSGTSRTWTSSGASGRSIRPPTFGCSRSATSGSSRPIRTRSCWRPRSRRPSRRASAHSTS